MYYCFTLCTEGGGLWASLTTIVSAFNMFKPHAYVLFNSALRHASCSKPQYLPRAAYRTHSFNHERHLHDRCMRNKYFTLREIRKIYIIYPLQWEVVSFSHKLTYNMTCICNQWSCSLPAIRKTSLFRLSHSVHIWCLCVYLMSLKVHCVKIRGV